DVCPFQRLRLKNLTNRYKSVHRREAGQLPCSAHLRREDSRGQIGTSTVIRLTELWRGGLKKVALWSVSEPSLPTPYASRPMFADGGGIFIRFSMSNSSRPRTRVRSRACPSKYASAAKGGRLTAGGEFFRAAQHAVPPALGEPATSKSATARRMICRSRHFCMWVRSKRRGRGVRRWR